MKKVYIRVWGCQMNVYDAELIRSILESSGYAFTDIEDDADIILLHTCSVREKAEEKVFNKLDTLAGVKRNRKPDMILGISGCMAENQTDYINKHYPEVNVLCGPGSYLDLPALLQRAESDRTQAASLGFEDQNGYPVLKPVEQKLHAFVAIMRGCNNFCSYCIVPYVRGRESSRPMDEIVQEVSILTDNGVKDITLLGQNVNSYGVEFNYDFIDLLARLNSINDTFRIRFVTSHPKDATERLFYAIRDLDKVCPYLHLPMQSGSDTTLRMMNRKYSRQEYLDKIHLLRSIVPGIALSSDFIVGFPNESEEDFQQTVSAYREVEYDSSFIFKYSVRSGTKAAEYDDTVPQHVKEERNRILLDLQAEISLKRNKNFVGKTLEILVEGNSRRNPHRLTGRSPEFKQVVFDGDASLIGSFVPVTIDRVSSLTLFGNIYND